MRLPISRGVGRDLFRPRVAGGTSHGAGNSELSFIPRELPQQIVAVRELGWEGLLCSLSLVGIHGRDVGSFFEYSSRANNCGPSCCSSRCIDSRRSKNLPCVVWLLAMTVSLYAVASYSRIRDWYNELPQQVLCRLSCGCDTVWPRAAVCGGTIASTVNAHLRL